MVKSVNPTTPDSIGTPVHPSRRKADEDISNTRASKKPRTRVSYSCGECHRRKQKCDRQVPCSHCVARKVPELCKAYTPGKTDQDVNLRLSRLEHIVEAALPHYWKSAIHEGTEGRRSHSPSADDDNRSQADDEEMNGGTFESGKWYGNTAFAYIAAPAVLSKLESVVDGNANGESSGLATRSASVDHLSSHTFHHPDHKRPDIVAAALEPTPADKLKSLIQDCGVAPHKISELVHELPPRSLSDKLVDFYFHAINWTRYPISERDFRKSYAAIFADSTTVNPTDTRFLPLLFVVLAIAVRLAPDNIIGDIKTRKLTSSRYYWSSRRSLLIAAAIQPDCLEMVLTRLLSARFLILDRKATECWSQLGAAVRTAQALGLHRDASTLPIDPWQAEYRRRIWAYLYHADRTYALSLGRPSAIHDDYTSTRPPMNIEDDINSTVLAKSQPLSTPTHMSYIVFRNTLAGIMGRMVHQFQKVSSPAHYHDILAIDEELLEFMQNLPPHFAVEPDTSLDQTHPYIPAHRYLLVTEVLHVRIALHRPYLLRRLGSDRYLRSRNACFESAIQDYHIRREFLTSTPRDFRDPVAIAYREFLSAMISGIYLVLYPKGPHAERMTVIIDTYIRDHEGVAEMDATTRRESKIIEFLKAKATQVASPELSGAPTPSRSTDPERPHNDAQLLLGLHRSSPRGPGSSRLAGMSSPPGMMGSDSPGGPSPDYSRPMPYPLFQLQQEGQSPSGFGSPTNGEDDSAQSLLDQWCNVFSGGPAVDNGSVSTGFPWTQPGVTSDLAWFNGAAPAPDLNSGSADLDGLDWSYWENLIKQIRSGPVA
ncbi:fungal-specific transcription factor domain-containing protein [Cristinia sonorae]|uniref:Fungal-specific transcription factor domain-containing protein n=1 Tax=Cristinia sonorae TaxID=1940300 RepID=A0A8K0UW29_9AGAR|nr:fungal-specific transcription factor domain-containing protein [Cristinia sonorae]